MTKTLVLAALLLGATTVAAQPKPASPTPGTPAGGPTAPPTPPGPGAPNTGTPKPSPTAGMSEDEKKALARSEYEKGLSAYNLGNFDVAIAAFSKAYEISQAPGLLFNIAQSHRLKKDYERAIYFYQTYLRLKPDAANRADVEERIKESQDLVAKQKEQDSKPPVGTVTPEGNPTQKEPTVNVNIVNPKVEGPGNAQSLMTAGMATAGAGGALIITGVVFGRMASNAEKELNELNAQGGTWTQAHQDQYDAGKRNNLIAIIAFVGGGAAVATGATLYVLGMLKKKNATVAVNPTPGGSTVAVGWSF